MAALRVSLRATPTQEHDSPMPATAPAVPVDDPQDLFDRFRQLLALSGLSYRRAGQICGVDTSTVYRWNHGVQRHTHRGKDDALRAGIETIEWYCQQRASRQLSQADLLAE